MGRKRKSKLTYWEMIHQELAEILMATRWQKTTREYIKLTYFGTGKELRRRLIRMLNQLESMDKELGYGISSEDRWTEVHNGSDSGGGSDGNRDKD